MWKDVKGYEGWYEVSDTGKVRSVDRIVIFSDGRERKYKGQELATYLANGYPRVTLKKNSKYRRVNVHILVANAFCAGEGECVRHLDGNPQNNSASNLRYGTHKQNHEDTHRHGRRPHGETHYASKLTPDEVSKIKELKGLKTCREIAEQFNTSPTTVCNIQQQKRWVHHKGENNERA